MTSEDKKSLHSLFELGWSDEDFAARLNRSIPQIIYYRRKFGLKRGTRHWIPWSESDAQLFLELMDARVPYKDMVGQLSCARSVVSLQNRARALAINFRKHKYVPWTKEEEENLIHLVKLGETDEEIQVQLESARDLGAIAQKRRMLGFYKTRRRQ